MGGILGGLADALDIDEAMLAGVATAAMMDVWAGASGSFNNGQLILMEYIVPAMEDVILAEPSQFEAGDVEDAGLNAHWAADQALSDTISAAAGAAQDARDAVQDALDVVGGVL